MSPSASKVIGFVRGTRILSLRAFGLFAACGTNVALIPLIILFARSMIRHPTLGHLTTLLFLWQTIITGGLAIVAAVIGALAAISSINVQLAAAKRKDGLQARCLAIAIAPELLHLKIDFERAKNVVSQGFYLAKSEGWATSGTVKLILDAQIKLPSILNQSIQQLYLLEDTGTHLLQLTSVTMQYNQLVKNLSENISNNIDRFGPPAHEEALSGHLRVIEKNIADAERLIEPLHDDLENRA